MKKTHEQIIDQIRTGIIQSYPFFEIEIDRDCKGICGRSVYLSISGKKYKRWVGLSVRISDHEIGTLRYADHYHVSTDSPDLTIANLMLMLSSSYNTLLAAELGDVPKTQFFRNCTNDEYRSYMINQCSAKIREAINEGRLK